jgi:hypothetical protein
MAYQEVLRSTLQTHEHGQTNPGVSDPQLRAEGYARARPAGSLTPGFVQSRRNKPVPAGGTERRPDSFLLSVDLFEQQAVTPSYAFHAHPGTAFLVMRARLFWMRTTFGVKVVPRVVLDGSG